MTADARHGQERLLVKVPNWLGDLVLIHSALRSLHRELDRGGDDVSLSVMVPERLAGFYRATPWIDDVVTHPWPVSWRVRRHLAAVSAIRAHRPDRILLVPGSFECALWPWLARVPRRVGASSEGRSPLLTARFAGPKPVESDHLSEHYRKLLSALAGIDLTTEPTPPDVCPEASERVDAWLSTHRRQRRRPLMALAPASAQRHKRWPPRRWAELSDALADDAEVLLVVAPWERPIARDVSARARRPLLVSSDLDVAELVALAARVDGWIGNDSGPSHVAAALGTPTLALFVTTDPARSRPLGPTVAAVAPEGDREGPTSDSALDAWEALGRRPPVR